MICNNCGTQNNDDARFCVTCGADMAAQPVAEAAYAAPAEAPSKATTLIGMICGIAAAVLCCFWFLSIPAGIVGLIFSLKASKASKAVGEKNGMALAGIICACVGLGFAAIALMFTCSACICGGCGSCSSLYYYL